MKRNNDQLYVFILVIVSFFVGKFVIANDYTVTKSKGKVTILAPGKHVAENVYEGMNVQADSSIVTSEASYVKVTDEKGSTIMVGPSSKAVIKTLSTPTEPSVIILLKGALRNKVVKDNMNIKQIVKTRSVSLGIRGTEYSLNYNPVNSASSLVMYEGVVAVDPVVNYDLESDQNDVEYLKQKLEDTSLKVSEGQFFGINESTNSEVAKISEAQLDQLKAKTNFEEPEDKKIKVQKNDMIADIENGTVISGDLILNDYAKKRDLKVSEILKEDSKWEYRFAVKPFLADTESRQTDNGQTYTTKASGLGVKAGMRTFKDDLSIGFTINMIQSQNDIKACSNCNVKTKREGEKQNLMGTNIYFSKDLSSVSTAELNFETEERETLSTSAVAKKEKIIKLEGIYTKVIIGNNEKFIAGNVSVGGGTMSRYGNGVILGLGMTGTFANDGNPISVYGGVNSEVYGDDKAKYESQKINLGVGFEF